jgi:hypothetical protein
MVFAGLLAAQAPAPTAWAIPICREYREREFPKLDYIKKADVR